MKKFGLAHLAVLIVGFAISAPKVMAQLATAAELPSEVTPVIRAAEPRSEVTPVVPPSSRPLYQSPILAYSPPTEKEKLRLFEFDAFGPYAFATAAAFGRYQQEIKSPPEWGSGWSGLGDRVASNFGIQLVTTTTRYGLAEMLHEDAAYYRCECGGFFPRARHALISTLTARRGQDGHTVFSIPGLVSPYAGTMTALAWYPDRFGVKDGFRMGNYNLLGQAAGNLAMEFIYGGPHTLFRHLGRSKSPGGTAPDLKADLNQ